MPSPITKRMRRAAGAADAEIVEHHWPADRNRNQECDALLLKWSDSAAARAASAAQAELKAASSVQQMLLQSASRPTPGFHVDSDLSARKRGQQRLLLRSTGTRRLASRNHRRCLRSKRTDSRHAAGLHDSGLSCVGRLPIAPPRFCFNLNNALVAQGQLGFTTACSTYGLVPQATSSLQTPVILLPTCRGWS